MMQITQMRISQRFIAAFALVFVVALSGCSRSGGSASLKIQMPDWQQLQVAERARLSKVSTLAGPELSKLEMVVVNITGPGMAPIYRSWENHDDSSTTVTPPSAWSFDVPRGTDRRVQAMAIFKDGGMAIYYDDALVQVQADTIDVALTLHSEISASTVVEGNIVGRFLRADGSTYTGKILYRYNPLSGAPSMVIHHGEMFAGWVKLFALNSNFLSYTTADGEPLFAGQNNASPSLLAPAPESARTARILVPAGYVQRNDNNTVSYEQKNRRNVVVGFFGPGAGSRRICYASTNETISQFYSDNTGTTSIYWRGSGGATASDAYVETAVTADGSSVKGGSSSANCSATGSEYVDFIKLNHMRLAREDNPLGFDGPFVRLASSTTDHDQFVDLSYSSGKLTVNWKYLPGAAAAIKGVAVFYRQNPNGTSWSDSDIRAEDGYRCSELTKLTAPFTELATITGGVETADITGITAALAPTTQVVVCPVGNDGVYFNSGVMGQMGGGGGGGGTSSRLTLVQVFPNAGTNAAAPGDCVALKAQVVDKSDSPVTMTSALTVGLNVSTSGGVSNAIFYGTDNTCTGTVGVNSASVVIPSGASTSGLFYAKLPQAGFYSISVNPSGGANVWSGWFNLGGYYMISVTPAVPTAMNISGPTLLAPGSCYGYHLQSVYFSTPNNFPAVFTADKSMALSLLSVAGSYYETSDCSGSAVTSITFPAYAHERAIYFKPSTASQAGSLQAATSDNVFTPVLGVQVGDLVLHHYWVGDYSNSNDFDLGQCREFFVRPANAIGAGIGSPSAKSITITAAGGTLYASSSDCDSSANGTSSKTVTLSSGSWESSRLYFKSATSAVALTATDGTITGAATYNPRPPANFTLHNPDGTNFNGVVPASCFEAKLRARDSYGNAYVMPAATSFNLFVSGGASGQIFATATDCAAGTASVGQITFASGASEKTFYFKVSTGSGLSFHVTTTSGPAMSWQLSAGSVMYWNLIRSPSGTINQGQCVALMPAITSPITSDLAVAVRVSNASNLETNANGGYFFNSDCSAPMGSGTTTSLTLYAGSNQITGVAVPYIKFQTAITGGVVPMIELVDQSGNTIFSASPSSCSTSTNCLWP